MKNRLLLLVLLVLAVVGTVGCSPSGVGECEWTLTSTETLVPMRDKVAVHTDVDLSRVAAYHGRYYCLFSYSGLFPMNHDVLMYVIDSEGNVVEWMPMPMERVGYDDLFVRHDTLFFSRYGSWEKEDLYFDTVGRQWKGCPKVDDMIWEDEDYRVYTMDNGEFGQWTWFEQRATGREYVMEGVGDVHRARDTYYIVEGTLVLTLTLDQLAASEPSDEKRQATDTSYSAIPMHRMQPDTLYRDSRYDPFAYWLGIQYDTLIRASLVDDQGLLLLVDLPQTTALMRVGDSNRLLTEFELGERFPVSIWHNSVRGMSMGGHRVLPFGDGNGRYGVLDIGDRQVKVLEIRHDVDTLPVLTDDGLETLLPFLAENLGRVTDSGMRTFERRIGGTLLGPESIERNGYFRDVGFNDGHHIDWYYQRVDTLYLLETEMCVRDSDKMVVAVFMDMMRPEPYYGKNGRCEDYEERQQREERLQAMMTRRLEDLCGKPRRKGDELHYRLGPLTVIYYTGSDRMLIF